jgi:hypothetical protein
MAFALFYNRQDASQIAAEITRSDLSTSDKNLAQKLWNGGLKNWSSAPVAPVNSPYFGEGVPDNPTLMIVVNAVGVSKQNLIDWLNRLAPTSGCYYLGAIAADVAVSAVEPWPPA